MTPPGTSPRRPPPGTSNGTTPTGWRHSVSRPTVRRRVSTPSTATTPLATGHQGRAHGAAQDEITIYVGGFERSLTGSIAGQLTPYDEIHLADRDTRLAMIQRGAPHPADGITNQPVRYQLADHLLSVIVTLGSRRRPKYRGIPALRGNLIRQLRAQAIPLHRQRARRGDRLRVPSRAHTTHRGCAGGVPLTRPGPLKASTYALCIQQPVVEIRPLRTTVAAGFWRPRRPRLVACQRSRCGRSPRGD